MIFVDSDYYIGLYYKQDAHHQRCLNISTEITDDLVTSWDVVDEVSTKLSYNVTQETAVFFLDDIKKHKTQLIYPYEELFSAAYKIFKLQSSKHSSWTDCVNMAIARSIGITTFLSFDQIYEKNGFKLFK